MASATLIPVAEYLETTYRPDCEYIDGEVRERNVGKWEHARLQWLLALWFGNHESAWSVIGSTEQRIWISPTRVRIPDLVLVKPGSQPDVLTEPPILIVEILSPDDTYSELEERCRDYQAMGVETVWLIDPKTRSGKMCTGAKWVAGERLTVAGTEIFVDLSVLFAGLNSAAGA